MRKFGVVVGVLALAGCQATKPISEMSYPERMELAGEILKRCEGYGLKQSTPQFDQCTSAEVDAEIARLASDRQAQRAMGAALMANGQAMSSAAYARRPLSCQTTQSYGGSSTTTCY